MKRFLAGCLLALPLLATPVRAETLCFGPLHVDAAATYSLRVNFNGCDFINACSPHFYWYGNAGPWYLYWPYEAHLNPPSPMTFPYWPVHQAPAGRGSSAQALTPAGYYYSQGAPSYWYGH